MGLSAPLSLQLSVRLSSIYHLPFYHLSSVIIYCYLSLIPAHLSSIHYLLSIYPPIHYLFIVSSISVIYHLSFVHCVLAVYPFTLPVTHPPIIHHLIVCHLSITSLSSVIHYPFIHPSNHLEILIQNVNS